MTSEETYHYSNFHIAIFLIYSLKIFVSSLEFKVLVMMCLEIDLNFEISCFLESIGLCHLADLRSSTVMSLSGIQTHSAISFCDSSDIKYRLFVIISHVFKTELTFFSYSHHQYFAFQFIDFFPSSLFQSFCH